jgi:hypothetical protein
MQHSCTSHYIGITRVTQGPFALDITAFHPDAAWVTKILAVGLPVGI